MQKLIYLPLMLLCLFAYHQSVAQVDVTVNPIGLLFKDLSIGADFAVAENFSIEATLGFSSGKTNGTKYNGLPINVFG